MTVDLRPARLRPILCRSCETQEQSCNNRMHSPRGDKLTAAHQSRPKYEAPRVWCGSLRGAALKIIGLFCVFVLQSAAHPVQLSTVRVDIDQKTTRVAVVIHTSQLAGASPATAIPARLHLRLDG